MLTYTYCPCADPEGDRGSGPPEKLQTLRFFSNFGPYPLKNHKATKPACNVWPTSARQRNAIQMAFRWRVDDGQILGVFGSIHSLTKKTQSWTSSEKLAGSVHAVLLNLEARLSPEIFFKISTCYCGRFSLDQYNRSESSF